MLNYVCQSLALKIPMGEPNHLLLLFSQMKLFDILNATHKKTDFLRSSLESLLLFFAESDADSGIDSV